MDKKDKPHTGLAMARDLCKNRGQRAERAKREGEKVIGYYCCFPPAELIAAANLFPYRITGDIHEPVTEGAVYLDTNMCPFLRSSFDLAMKGKYDFLDGIVVPNACRNMRRFHVFWRDNVKPAYVHYLNVPHTATSASIDFYEAELAKAKAILIEGENEVKAMRQQIEALKQEGGRDLIRMRIAEQLMASNAPFFLVDKGAGTDGNLDFSKIDYNEFLRQMGAMSLSGEEPVKTRGLRQAK